MARFIDATQSAARVNIWDDQFKEYYTVYKSEDLKSGSGVFDPTKVNKMIIFVNRGHPNNFIGELIVDEVSFVRDLPE